MPADWNDFFVATAGASAALAGLIIVAMTVNIQTIIRIPAMTSRAAATIGSLVLIVVTASAALIPSQPPALLGLELLVFSFIAITLAIDSSVRMLRAAEGRYLGVTWLKVVLAIAQIVPFLLGSVLLVMSDWTGLNFLAGGILLVFIGSITTAWVLLVEILR